MLATVFDYLKEFQLFIVIAFVVAIVILKNRIVAWLSEALGIRRMERDITRTRLMVNIKLSPFEGEAIEEDYKDYKAMDGNGYVDGVVERWRKSYAAGLAARRAGTWDGKERRNNNRQLLD